MGGQKNKGQGQGNNTSPRNLSAKQRAAKAFDLRLGGLTYQVIADQLGYRSPASAYKAVKRVMDKMVQEPAERLLKHEENRLDKMLAAVWAKVLQGHLGATDRALRIMERRAKLLGLDAPEKRDWTIGGGDAESPIRVYLPDNRRPANGYAHTPSDVRDDREPGPDPGEGSPPGETPGPDTEK